MDKNIELDSFELEELKKFSRNVMTKLLFKDVPPLPYYYNITFFNEIQNIKNPQLKEKINNLCKILNNNYNIEIYKKQNLIMEEKINEINLMSEQILKRIKNIKMLNKKTTEELNSILENVNKSVNAKITEKYISKFKEKLKAIQKEIEKENRFIKLISEKKEKTIKEIQKNSIFDIRYGVYNMRYFLEQLDKELHLNKHINIHKSFLILIKIKNEIFNKIKKNKHILNSVNKIIARNISIFFKNSITTITKDNIFATIYNNNYHLKNSDIEKMSEELKAQIENIPIVINGKELFLEAEIYSFEINTKEKKKYEESYLFLYEKIKNSFVKSSV